MFSIINIKGFSQIKALKFGSKEAAEKLFKGKNWAEDPHLKPHKTIDGEEFAKQMLLIRNW